MRSPPRGEAFLDHFLLPLCSGGVVHVSTPLDRPLVDEISRVYLRDPLSSVDVLASHAASVERACSRRLDALWAAQIPFHLDRELLCLAAAAHNLLFLSHPGRGRLTVTRGGLRRVFEGTRDLLALPAPGSELDLLRRHVVAGKLLEMKRVDVDVSFWAGTRRFLGSEPPPRLMAWRRLRRVEQEQRTVAWLATPLDPQQVELLALFLRATPLSDLLLPHRPGPPLCWLGVHRYLAWPSVCRLVCQRYLELGLPTVGPPLARSFWKLAEEPDGSGRQQALRLVAWLVVHLHALISLTEDPTETLNQLLPQAQAPQEALGSVLLAARDCRLMPGPEVLGDGLVSDRLKQVTDAWARTLGAAGSALSGRLQAALQGASSP